MAVQDHGKGYAASQPGRDGHRPRPAVLGFPYEEGAYWRKGSKHAPAAIRQALTRLRPFSLQSDRRLALSIDEYFVDTPDLGPYDKDAALARIGAAVEEVLDEGRAPVVVGGDHSISLPVVQALARHYGSQTFSIIHLDAHSDTFPAVDGYDCHHGAIFRKMVELGLVEAPDIHQLGLRGFVPDGGMDFARGSGIHTLSVADIRASGCDLERLGVRPDRPCYVSVDIDVVDPGFAPGTGTPVPGGLTSSELLTLIGNIQQLPLVGFDLVEVAPAFDHSEITVLLAAHVLMEVLIGTEFMEPEPRNDR